MVATGEDARPGRGAQRSGVHVRVAQTAGGDPVDVGRLDQAAEAGQLPVADVVEHEEQDVRCPVRGPPRGGPGRLGLLDGPSDHSRERRTLFVLGDRHPNSSSTREPRLRGGSVLRPRSGGLTQVG